MAKSVDPVKLAKAVSKSTRLPLPLVAKIMQQNSLDAIGYKKSIAACQKLAAQEVEKIMNKINPF